MDGSAIAWILVLVGVIALLWVLFGALATSRRSRSEKSSDEPDEKRG